MKYNIRSHVLSCYPALYLVTHDEAEVDELIRNLADDFKNINDDRKISEWNLARGLVHFDTGQPLAEWSDLSSALEHFLLRDLDRDFIVIRDAHLGLRDQPLAVARLKALINKIIKNDEGVATIFLVSSQPFIPPELEKLITLFDIPLPDESAILEIVKKTVDEQELTIDDETARKLALALQGLTSFEVRQLIYRGYQENGNIGLEAIDLVQGEKQQIIKKSGILEMLKVNENMEDIGGLEKLKPWLKQKAKIMNDWPAARTFGVEPPKGVMIVGMPGCGKSLTAKATAALFNLPLLKLDIGSLMGKYVGESEGNMRRAIKVAEAVSPCVLWVDEVEKAFVGIGSGGSGAEVSTRLFGYFLTWMQEKTKQVFVIATANDISALPPELLRKGRFDEIFYVDFPTEKERFDIFKVHLSKRNKMSSNIQLDGLAKATEGYSGADIESVVKEAIEQAFINDRATLDNNCLLAIVENTHPLREVMKKKVKEYEDRFAEMKIKSAS